METASSLTQTPSENKMKVQQKPHGYCYWYKNPERVSKKSHCKNSETVNNPNICLITLNYYELNHY